MYMLIVRRYARVNLACHLSKNLLAGVRRVGNYKSYVYILSDTLLNLFVKVHQGILHQVTCLHF